MSLKAALGAVFGALIGLAVGGLPGALKGAVQGYAIGLAFEDTQLAPGPRLEDLKFNDSSYGTVIPRLYGTDRLTANIIWMNRNNLDYRQREEVVAKGLFSDTVRQVYDYYANFAVLLCEGPIDEVLEIKANGYVIYSLEDGINIIGDRNYNLIQNTSGSKTIAEWKEIYENNYDSPGLDPNASDIRIYKGDVGQLPDPIIGQDPTVDAFNVPAFRNCAYVVFQNLALSNIQYRNQLPTLTFKVRRSLNTERDVQAKFRSAENTGIEYFMYIDSIPSTTRDGTSTELNKIILDNFGSGSVFSEVDNGTNEIFSLNPGSSGLIHEVYAITDNKYIHYFGEFGTGLPDSAEDFRTFTYTHPNGIDIPVTAKKKRYWFQTHDIQSLQNTPNQILAEQPTDPKNVTSLIKESMATLFDFDLQVPVLPNSFRSTPVQNLPDWIVCVTDLGDMQVGQRVGDRFVLWNIGRNYNERVQQGTSIVTKQPIYNFEHFRAVYHKGYIYIYNKARYYSYTMEGLIAVDINNLEPRSPVNPPTPALAAPKTQIKKITRFSAKSGLSGSSVSLRLVSRKTVDNFVTPVRKFRSLDPSRVQWNQNILFSHLAIDYEQNKIYCHQFFREDSSSFSELSTLANGAIPPITLDNHSLTELEVGNINNVLSKRYLNDSAIKGQGVEDSYNHHSLRAYTRDGAVYVDFGYYTIKSNDTIEDSYYTAVGCDTRLDIDIFLSGPSIFYPPDLNLSADIESTIGLHSSSLQNLTYNVIPFITTNNSSGFYYRNLISPKLPVFGGSQYQYVQRNQYQIVNTFFNDSQATASESPGFITEEYTVGDIIKEEISRTGKISVEDDLNIDALDTPVKGMSIKDRGPIVSVVKALQDIYIFDMVEYDYKINSDFRKNKVITKVIPEEELGAGERPGEPEYKLTTPRRGQLPSRYYVSFRNEALDYEKDTYVYEDPTSSGNVTLDIKIPLVVNEQEVASLARNLAFSTISARQGIFDFSTSFKHSDIEIGDFVNVNTSDNKSLNLRVINLDKGRPGLVKVSGIVDEPSNYNYQATISGTRSSTVEVQEGNSDLIVVNSLPFYENEDGIGYWVGAYSTLQTEAFSAQLAVLDEADQVIKEGVSLVNVTPVAKVLNSLPDVTITGEFDYRAEMEIQVSEHNRPFFVDRGEDEALATINSNTFFYGSGDSWEIIKIANFEDISEGKIRAKGILRGYKGTAHYGQHRDGEMLVGWIPQATKRILLPEALQDRMLSQIEVAEFTAPIISFNLSKNSNLPLDPTIVHARPTNALPLPPTKLYGYKRTDGSFYLEWVRQARYGVEWSDGTDVPLEQDTETYTVLLKSLVDDEIVAEIFVEEQNSIIIDEPTIISVYGAPQPTLTLAVVQNTDDGDYGNLSDIVTI